MGGFLREICRLSCIFLGNPALFTVLKSVFIHFSEWFLFQKTGCEETLSAWKQRDAGAFLTFILCLDGLVRRLNQES